MKNLPPEGIALIQVIGSLWLIGQYASCNLPIRPTEALEIVATVLKEVGFELEQPE